MRAGNRAVTVADASPLIALRQIDCLDLVHRLYGVALVPHTVAREVAPTIPALPEWIIVLPDPHPLRSEIGSSSLDDGESFALELAIREGASQVIVDERSARRMARILGLQVIGTVALLLAAKQKGHLSHLEPLLEALVKQGFFLSDALIESVLKAAGE